MRILVSSFCSSVLSVAIFAALWSGFVVQHHSYGGESRISQYAGTLAFFCVTLLPILVAIALGVSFLDSWCTSRNGSGPRRIWRWLAWLLVCLIGLGGLTAIANPLLHAASVTCSLIAGSVVGPLYVGLLKRKQPTYGLAQKASRH
jgi:cytochrome bd-type quinol oxidase subunit 2